MQAFVEGYDNITSSSVVQGLGRRTCHSLGWIPVRRRGCSMLGRWGDRMSVLRTIIRPSLKSDERFFLFSEHATLVLILFVIKILAF